MKGKNLHSSRGCGADPAFPLLHELDHDVPSSSFTGYLSLSHLWFKFDKEWLTAIRKSLHLCLDDTFYGFKAALQFSQAARVLWKNGPTYC